MTTLAVGIDARKAEQGANTYVNSVGRMVDANSRYVNSNQGGAKSIRNVGSAAGGLASTFRNLAGSISALFILRDMINVNQQYESTMATLRGITNATAGEMRILSDVAREMGANTKFSAAEAGDGLVFLARAGFSVKQATEALPATLNLAAASGMELGRSADIASNILSTFRLQASETGKVVDTLAFTSNKANTDVEQLAQAIKFSGPVAASLGQSLEETAATIGVLSDAGIQGALAGTSLRAIMTSLLKPTNEAQKQLADMGITLEEVNPATTSLSDILQRLRDANITTSQAVNIFGREAAGAAVIAANATDKIKALAGAQDEAAGTAQRMADIAANTLGGRLKGLRSAVEELFLQAGEGGLVGAMKDLVQVATEVVRVLGGNKDAIDNASTSAKTFVVAINLISGGIAGLWQIVSTVFSNLYRIIQEVGGEFGGAFFDSVEKGFSAIADGSITVEDLANGFVATIKKVGAFFQAFFVTPVVDAIVGIQNVWLGFANFFEAALENPIGAVAKGLATFAGFVLDTVKNLIDNLASLASFISDDLADSLKGLGGDVEGFKKAIDSAADEIAGDSAPKMNHALGQIGDGIAAAKSLILPTIDDLQARFEEYGASSEEINNWLATQVEERVARELQAEREKQEALKKLNTGDGVPPVPEDGTGDGTPPSPLTSKEDLQRGLDDLRQAFATEMELLTEQNAARLELINGAREQGLLGKVEYEDLETKIAEEYGKKRLEIEKKQQQERLRQRSQEWQGALTMADQSLKTIQTLLVASGNQSLAESKAFGVAQAVVSTAIGIARALELGFPAAIPAMALAAATGVAQIAAINNASKGSAAPPTPGGGSLPSSATAASLDTSVQSTQSIRQESVPQEGGVLTINVEGAGREDSVRLSALEDIGSLVDDYVENGGRFRTIRVNVGE